LLPSVNSKEPKILLVNAKDSYLNEASGYRYSMRYRLLRV